MRPTEAKGTLAGTLTALAVAGLGLATSFGVQISTAQHAAILTFCGAVALAAPVIGALFDHSNKQVAARQAVAATIAKAEPVDPAVALQAQIDALKAQKAALPK